MILFHLSKMPLKLILEHIFWGTVLILMIGFNFYSFHLSTHGTNLKLVCWTFPRLSSCWLGVGMLCLKPTHHSYCKLNPIIFLNYCCYFGFIVNNEHLWHDNYRVFLLPLPIFHTEKEKGKILASKQSRRSIEFSNFSFLEEFTSYSQILIKFQLYF